MSLLFGKQPAVNENDNNEMFLKQLRSKFKGKASELKCNRLLLLQPCRVCAEACKESVKLFV